MGKIKAHSIPPAEERNAPLLGLEGRSQGKARPVVCWLQLSAGEGECWVSVPVLICVYAFCIKQSLEMKPEIILGAKPSTP